MIYLEEHLYGNIGEIFLTSIFMSNINENSAQITGIQAIACTLEHAKISQSPLKARLSIAKFLWLIKILTSFGGSEKILVSLNELLEKYVDNETINPSNWLFWLNALLMEAQQRPSPAILNILKCIGKAFPQKMFYDLRIVLGSKNVTEYLQKYYLFKIPTIMVTIIIILLNLLVIPQ
uniref:Uncharacterized protein n=1 Tax=Meloidogyne incognita TaxID=6306 RepID=A0A914M384_MELIC